MTSPGENVNVEDMEAAKAANAMYEAVQAIRGTINNINGDVQDVKSGWHGDAQAAFQTAAAAWEGEADRLNGILDMVQAQVEDGNNAYLSMETANEDEMKPLTSL